LKAPPPIAGSWGEEEEAKLTSVMIPLSMNLLSIIADLSTAND
jgi:hypothetical protein